MKTLQQLTSGYITVAPCQLRSPSTTVKSTHNVSRLVEDLVLNTTLPYSTIVNMVLEEFPMAKTSTKSVASVSCVMRKKGLSVPMRVVR